MEKRNTIIARSGSEMFVFTSYKNFCKAAQVPPKYPIPNRVEVEGFGSLKLESHQLNVSFQCHRLRRALRSSFQLISDKMPVANGMPPKLEHTFIVKDGMYYVVTNVELTKVFRVKYFQMEIEVDEGTEEIILKRFNP